MDTGMHNPVLMEIDKNNPFVNKRLSIIKKTYKLQQQQNNSPSLRHGYNTTGGPSSRSRRDRGDECRSFIFCDQENIDTVNYT